MKKLISTTILTVLMASAAVAGRQDYPEEYLGLPGDNLNLYAVMKLFQESETLEAFEKDLNDENSRINNLDLNTDGYVDYITISDYPNGDVHNIVMRAVLDRNEYQDVAVITVEKLRNGEVQVQLIGDEALYGRNYIVEPIYAETPNPGYRGKTVYRNNVTVVTTTYYDVAAWPVISFMYSPRYIMWRSSWYWGYYPVYWRPWRPFFWHQYYGYHYHWYPVYYSYYRHWDRPRYIHYHDYYYKSVRAYSPNVSHRITEGSYRQTYSKPETRRDGEALYVSTQGTRSNNGKPVTSQGNVNRRASATGSMSSGKPSAGNYGETRRASGSQSAGQNGETRRATNATVKNSPASAGRSNSQSATSGQSAARRQVSTEQRTQSTVQRSSQSSATRTQSTVQKSTQSSGSRSQGTVQRSTQTSGNRSQSTVQKSSQPPSSRSQATVQRAPSRQSVSQKSSPSVSQRSSATAARSQAKSSSQPRSSSSSSQSKSSSKSSSKKSDESKSTRR